MKADKERTGHTEKRRVLARDSSMASEALPDRPYVILSAAMSLDGKIATKSGDSELSCFEDKVRVHRLRAEVDAIMVGINTVLKDDPKLTVKYAEGPNPIRIVVDSRARTPLSARVLDGSARTVIAVSKRASPDKTKALRERGAEVIIAGEDKVDLKELLRALKRKGVRILMLEGGGTLNWGMLKEGLIDEVRVAIAPVLVGGRDAVTLVEGEGFSRVAEGEKLRLERIEQCGEDLVLTYKVLR